VRGDQSSPRKAVARVDLEHDVAFAQEIPLAEKQRSLIIVADRETARFFRHTHPGAPLEETGSLDRPSLGDRNADRPGRTFETANKARHAMEPPTSYQEAERQAMAAEVAEFVHAGLDEHEIDRLVLVADPKILGELRSALRKSARERVVLEIGSHLTQADPHELAQRLSEDGTLGLVREPSPRTSN
jgi:protein required for attachment to host cells